MHHALAKGQLGLLAPRFSCLVGKRIFYLPIYLTQHILLSFNSAPLSGEQTRPTTSIHAHIIYKYQKPRDSLYWMEQVSWLHRVSSLSTSR